jgi:hypothetical protein
MTVLIALALLFGLVIGLSVPLARRRLSVVPELPRTHRILLPFTATTLTSRALAAAIRLAGAEHARLMPSFLATVPLTVPLDGALPRQSRAGMPLLEAIEQRAIAEGIAVDSRVETGRTYRHALARLLEHEHVDRVIISATAKSRVGLSGPDLLWLLDHTDAEVVILRPAAQDAQIISSDNAQPLTRPPAPRHLRVGRSLQAARRTWSARPDHRPRPQSARCQPC